MAKERIGTITARCTGGNTIKEKKLSEALRHEEQKRKESERQAYQNHSSTIQEIEQLRRRNQDLAESVQSLTHALQTLTGSGEKRGHGNKKYAKSSKKNSLKRSRQDHDDIAIDRHSMYTPSSDSKFADKNGGKNHALRRLLRIMEGQRRRRRKLGKILLGETTSQKHFEGVVGGLQILKMKIFAQKKHQVCRITTVRCRPSCRTHQLQR